MSQVGNHDFHLHVVELHNTGPSLSMTLPSLISYASAFVGKPVQPGLVVLGDMSLGGSIKPVRDLAAHLQVAFDAGAKRILLPMSNVQDIPTVPGDLFVKFRTAFYSGPEDAVLKAVGTD